MHILLHLAATTASILLITWLLPTLLQADGFRSALIAALVLGLVNAILRPILVLLTFPLTVLTLGLFLLVLNGLLLMLVAAMVSGFRVNGFWGAIGASVLISGISWVVLAVFA
jgi:putative membrane protein